MDSLTLAVLVILLSGFLASWLCKHFKISPLIGYLVVGALIGPGGFDLTRTGAIEKELAAKKINIEEIRNEAKKELKTLASLPPEQLEEEVRVYTDETIKQRQRINELEKSKESLSSMTELGVLLLLFAIGIEFTFDKLAATAKYMFVGGVLQMGITIGLTILACVLFKMSWLAGLALGSVIALSSTALVYRSYGDLGQADTKRAQATLGLLIFQDIALVPLLLILPQLLGASGDSEQKLWTSSPWTDMVIKSAIFCFIVVAIKLANVKFIINKLAKARSNDLVILYAIIVLLIMCASAQVLGLTPALGALAAGVALGENRLTPQIDALVMPFREMYSAMFFISLGMLTDFSYVFHHPFTCIVALIGIVTFKALCATVALRACGMDSRGALAYGTSISQIGELAFMLLAVAIGANAISETVYNTMLFVSVGSLVLTPTMVNIALTKFGMPPETSSGQKHSILKPALLEAISRSSGHSIVIGAGYIGQSLATALVDANKSLCLIDFNPINLQPFEQQGVNTIAGDGADQEILRQAGIDRAEMIFVTVPRDDLALNVVKAARNINPTAFIISRARFHLYVSQMKRAGAQLVLCEESHIADELTALLRLRFSSESELAAVQ